MKQIDANVTRKNPFKVDGHPALTYRPVLTEQNETKRLAFKKLLGPVATREQLKAANRTLYGRKASPTFLTKNNAYRPLWKTSPGVVVLVAWEGKTAKDRAKIIKDALTAYREKLSTAKPEASSKKPEVKAESKPVPTSKKTVAAKRTRKKKSDVPAAEPDMDETITEVGGEADNMPSLEEIDAIGEEGEGADEIGVYASHEGEEEEEEGEIGEN